MSDQESALVTEWVTRLSQALSVLDKTVEGSQEFECPFCTGKAAVHWFPMQNHPAGGYMRAGCENECISGMS